METLASLFPNLISSWSNQIRHLYAAELCDTISVLPHLRYWSPNSRPCKSFARYQQQNKHTPKNLLRLGFEHIELKPRCPKSHEDNFPV